MATEALALPKPNSQAGLNTLMLSALTAICLLGLGLRGLGIASESFWLDEATSLNLARLPLADLATQLPKEDVHPPLYFALLHFWIAGGDGVAFLRLFSVVSRADLPGSAQRPSPVVVDSAVRQALVRSHKPPERLLERAIHSDRYVPVPASGWSHLPVCPGGVRAVNSG